MTCSAPHCSSQTWVHGQINALAVLLCNVRIGLTSMSAMAASTSKAPPCMVISQLANTA